METSATSISPILIRNLFMYADTSLLKLAQKYTLLQFFRRLILTFSLFFFRLLPSLFPPSLFDAYALQSAKLGDSFFPDTAAADSGIARSLSHVLSIVNDIPVSSRKYEVVRSLADRLIDENQNDNVEALRQVNRTVLSAAFARTLTELEAVMVELGGAETIEDHVPVMIEGTSGHVPVRDWLNRFARKVRSVRDGVLARVWRTKEDVNRSRTSAEKLAAELLWLAGKMTACGFGQQAVKQWASASNISWLALSAEPRLQGTMIKLSGNVSFVHALLQYCFFLAHFYVM